MTFSGNGCPVRSGKEVAGLKDMSLYDYRISQRITELDPPFSAVIMAAIARAEEHNGLTLRAAFP